MKNILGSSFKNSKNITIEICIKLKKLDSFYQLHEDFQIYIYIYIKPNEFCHFIIAFLRIYDARILYHYMCVLDVVGLEFLGEPPTLCGTPDVGL